MTICKCPIVVNWVCGNDGRSYTSKCVADCLNVTVVSNGTCLKAGGKKNQTRSPNVTVCNCNLTIDWVCGNDKVAYSNSCVCGCFGVNVSYSGVCQNSSVPNTPICNCTNVTNWVCGTNGQSYLNQCYANFSQATVAYQGQCKNNYTSCCSLDNSPVCGSDGQTYTNACIADYAGVTVDYEGECILVDCQQDCPCDYTPVCANNDLTYINYCDLKCIKGLTIQANGECPGNSACQCNRGGVRVCGINHKIYENECFANCDGMTVQPFQNCLKKDCHKCSEGSHGNEQHCCGVHDPVNGNSTITTSNTNQTSVSSS